MKIADARAGDEFARKAGAKIAANIFSKIFALCY